MKNMNEIKNEKRLTKMFKSNTFFSLSCDEGCPSWKDDECNCERVLANRLAKYEDIGRDLLDLPEDEVVPIDVVEKAFRIGVLFILNTANSAVKCICDALKKNEAEEKKAGEKDDNV